MNRPAPHPLRHRRFTWSRLAWSGACAAGVLFLAACATEPEPAPAADSTKYTLENTDRFVVLDHTGRSAVTCTGFTEHALADGRLEVVANLKNRENRPVVLQTSCLFKDESGQNELEETAWQTIAVPANTTEAVHFTASSAAAKMYTVRVRDVR